MDKKTDSERAWSIYSVPLWDEMLAESVNDSRIVDETEIYDINLNPEV